MADDDVLYDLGVDLDSSFSFHDGDLVLCKYDNNLVQAVVNRLNTDLDEMELFYDNYGSVLTSFFGWRKTDETLGFIKSELETVLKAEPRLVTWSYEVYYTDDGSVRIDLVLNPNTEYEISVTLQLNSDGNVELVEEEA